jgi:hypothetical protein
MTDASTIIQIIDRLRRAQPRNQDTMVVCDELERLLHRQDSGGRLSTSTPAVTAVSCGRFDRVAYQREYMKGWRQRQAQAVALSS